MENNNENLKLSKEEDKLLTKEIIKAFKSVMYIHKSRPPKDEVELDDVYLNTLQKHNFKDSFPSHSLSPFYKLAKFDNINQHKNDNYFIKLDQLLKYLKLHQVILQEYKNTSKNSTVNTSYSTIKNYIEPQIKIKERLLSGFKDSYIGNDLENDKTFLSIQKTTKILNLYRDNPLIASLWIQASNNNELDFITEGYKKELQKENKTVFSYKLKLSKRDIIKSFQAYAIDIYHKDSVHNQLMKNPRKKIEKKMLVNLIGEISKKLLDETISKPHVKNVDSQFYYIDIIKNMFILQPSTTKTARMKFNSFDDLLLKLDKSIKDLKK